MLEGKTAARIVAQIQNQAAQIAPVRGVERGEIERHIARRFRLLELGETQVAVIGLDQSRAHRRRSDNLARERERARRGGDGRSGDEQRNIRPRLAAHHPDGGVDIHILGRFAVDADNQIAAANPGARGRGFVDRRDDFDIAVSLPDKNSDAAVFARERAMQLLPLFRVQINRVRIQTADHSPNRRFDEIAAFHILDIIALDERVNAAEFVQPIARQVFPTGGESGESRTLLRPQSRRAAGRKNRQQRRENEKPLRRDFAEMQQPRRRRHQRKSPGCAA